MLSRRAGHAWGNKDVASRARESALLIQSAFARTNASAFWTLIPRGIVTVTTPPRATVIRIRRARVECRRV